jgi:hypothetical protein
LLVGGAEPYKKDLSPRLDFHTHGREELPFCGGRSPSIAEEMLLQGVSNDLLLRSREHHDSLPPRQLMGFLVRLATSQSKASSTIAPEAWIASKALSHFLAAKRSLAVKSEKVACSDAPPKRSQIGNN